MYIYHQPHRLRLHRPTPSWIPACYARKAKIILVLPEAGSISLRGMRRRMAATTHAMPASKSACWVLTSAAGRSSSFAHPGFMRTEITAGVGADPCRDASGDKLLPPFFSLFLLCFSLSEALNQGRELIVSSRPAEVVSKDAPAPSYPDSEERSPG